MIDDYDSGTAKHYRLYRPPLHELILKDQLEKDTTFSKGLDIGCGTGQSALSLKQYCEKVIGLEPSQDMLDKAITHPCIEYYLQKGEKLNFEDNTFGIITFAGSLFYAKSSNLFKETIRVLKNEGVILIYDFEIILEKMLGALGVENNLLISDYDHEINFDDFSSSFIKKQLQVKKRDQIIIRPAQIAHLILSLASIRQFFENKFQQKNIYARMVELIIHHFGPNTIPLDCLLYATRYQCQK